jgi:hypothetical protein
VAAAPAAGEAAQAQAAPQAAAATPTAAAPEQPKPLGWKAFFPRSRLPKQQVENLNIGNQYQ